MSLVEIHKMVARYERARGEWAGLFLSSAAHKALHGDEARIPEAVGAFMLWVLAGRL